MNVQHLLPDTPADARDSFTAVVCLSCAGMHYVNNTTGKLLGEK
jgi:hypothetical protein